MKKANRILMATVAVLLSLVLITTSVVSGIFARFTVLQEAKTKMTLNKFGVSLGLTLSDEFVALLGGEDAVDDMTTVNGDSISINITNLKMAPGDIWDKAFNVSIDGTPTVDCRFKFDVDLNLDADKFTIPAGECGLTKETDHFPIYFTRYSLDSNSVYTNSVYFSDTLVGDDISSKKNVEGVLHAQLVFGGIYFSDLIDDGKDGKALILDFEKDNEIFFNYAGFDFKRVPYISFKSFDLGFQWPFETDDLTNKKDTYIVDHNKETGIGFTYVLTISLEQVG